MSKKKNLKGGIVYSTDPDFNSGLFDSLKEDVGSGDTQNLRVWRQRIKGNKTVTQIRGLTLSESECKALAKELRSFCGAGGNYKNKEIIIQGDHADKVCAFLIQKGYKAKRAGG